MSLGTNQAGLLAVKCCLQTKVPVAQEADSSDFYSVFSGSGHKSSCTFWVRLLALVACRAAARSIVVMGIEQLASLCPHLLPVVCSGEGSLI